MRLNNSINEYGLVAKLFHWLTFIILLIQIPLGFYLVRLDFSDLRITLDEIHVIGGILVFYLTLFRLIYKFFNKSPKTLSRLITANHGWERLCHGSRVDHGSITGLGFL